MNPDDLTEEQYVLWLLQEIHAKLGALNAGLASEKLEIHRFAIGGFQMEEGTEICRLIIDVEFGPTAPRSIH